jgi:AcrR family transcriptional regulator
MSPRSDALRSRERILAAARDGRGEELRLNDIARRAGVGVGTVYRHFPTTHALMEALTRETLERMREIARAARDRSDEEAFAAFLGAALDLQLDDGGLKTVLLSPEDEEPGVAELKREIFAAFDEVLDRARRSGVVRADLDIVQIEHLICGIEYAVRLGASGDRAPFLEILLAGIRPTPAR